MISRVVFGAADAGAEGASRGFDQMADTKRVILPDNDDMY